MGASQHTPGGRENRLGLEAAELGAGVWAAHSQIETWDSSDLPRWTLKRAFAGAVWELVATEGEPVER